jgi:hypothetical protein
MGLFSAYRELQIGETVYVDDPTSPFHCSKGHVIGIDVGVAPYKVEFSFQDNNGVWMTSSLWFPLDRLLVYGPDLSQTAAPTVGKAIDEPANDPEPQPWTPGLGDEVIVTRRGDPLRGVVGTVQDKNGDLFLVWFSHRLVQAWFRAHELRPRRSNNPEIPDSSNPSETPNSSVDAGELERCEANEAPEPRKRVLYIAGPMRGVAWFNYPMFDRVAKELRDAGNEVISPADEDRKVGFDPFANPEYRIADACTFPSEASFESFDKTVRRCLEAVLRCDEIVLLPGWENSQGALAELAIAAWMGKRVRQVDIDEQDRLATKTSFMVNRCVAFCLSEAFWPNAVVFHETQKFISHFDDNHKDDEDILVKAYRITRGDRQASYGPPDQDFRRTAGMWSALFLSKLKDGVTFESRDVALAMILLKTSRETHQRKRDNWVDIAGYASCGSRCN